MDQQLAGDHPVRRVIITLACIAASVVAVVAVMAAPGWLVASRAGGPGQPLPPGPRPTPQEESIGTRTWAAQQCPGGSAHCRVPSLLNLAGAQFVHVAGHRQAVRQRDVASRTLVTRVAAGSGRRWLLVGAERSSSASALSVQLGTDGPAKLFPGTLTFLAVPGHQRHVQVRVTDDGRPGPGELLRVEEYDALG